MSSTEPTAVTGYHRTCPVDMVHIHDNRLDTSPVSRVYPVLPNAQYHCPISLQGRSCAIFIAPTAQDTSTYAIYTAWPMYDTTLDHDAWYKRKPLAPSRGFEPVPISSIATPAALVPIYAGSTSTQVAAVGTSASHAGHLAVQPISLAADEGVNVMHEPVILPCDSLVHAQHITGLGMFIIASAGPVVQFWLLPAAKRIPHKRATAVHLYDASHLRAPLQPLQALVLPTLTVVVASQRSPAQPSQCVLHGFPCTSISDTGSPLYEAQPHGPEVWSLFNCPRPRAMFSHVSTINGLSQQQAARAADMMFDELSQPDMTLRSMHHRLGLVVVQDAAPHELCSLALQSWSAPAASSRIGAELLAGEISPRQIQWEDDAALQPAGASLVPHITACFAMPGTGLVACSLSAAVLPPGTASHQALPSWCEPQSSCPLDKTELSTASTASTREDPGAHALSAPATPRGVRARPQDRPCRPTRQRSWSHSRLPSTNLSPLAQAHFTAVQFCSLRAWLKKELAVHSAAAVMAHTRTVQDRVMRTAEKLQATATKQLPAGSAEGDNAGVPAIALAARTKGFVVPGDSAAQLWETEAVELSSTALAHAQARCAKLLEADESTRLQVMVRCRPMLVKELREGARPVIVCGRNTVTVEQYATYVQPKSYVFGKVFGPLTSQRHLFQQSVLPLVFKSLAGYTCTVFMFGMTGSGKTFTCEGTLPAPATHAALVQGSGIIPRAAAALFQLLRSMPAQHAVLVSHTEIYNEQIFDLLHGWHSTDAAKSMPAESFSRAPSPCASPAEDSATTAAAAAATTSPSISPTARLAPAMSQTAASQMRVKAKVATGPNAQPGASTQGRSTVAGGAAAAARHITATRHKSDAHGLPEMLHFTADTQESGLPLRQLTEVAVHSQADVLRVLRYSHNKRVTHETRMNMASSRSHSIFTIRFSRDLPQDALGSAASGSVRGRMHFVDLSGSENVKRSGSIGDRLTETGNINRGLLALGRVIKSLAEQRQHVPYRDSKLTRCLQQALSGNSHTLMILTVSPSHVDADEAVATMNYAHMAKFLRTAPVQTAYNGTGELASQQRAAVPTIRPDLRAHEHVAQEHPALSTGNPAVPIVHPRSRGAYAHAAAKLNPHAAVPRQADALLKAKAAELANFQPSTFVRNPLSPRKALLCSLNKLADEMKQEQAVPTLAPVAPSTHVLRDSCSDRWASSSVLQPAEVRWQRGAHVGSVLSEAAVYAAALVFARFDDSLKGELMPRQVRALAHAWRQAIVSHAAQHHVHNSETVYALRAAGAVDGDSDSEAPAQTPVPLRLRDMATLPGSSPAPTSRARRMSAFTLGIFSMAGQAPSPVSCLTSPEANRTSPSSSMSGDGRSAPASPESPAAPITGQPPQHTSPESHLMHLHMLPARLGLARRADAHWAAHGAWKQASRAPVARIESELNEQQVLMARLEQEAADAVAFAALTHLETCHHPGTRSQQHPMEDAHTLPDRATPEPTLAASQPAPSAPPSPSVGGPEGTPTPGPREHGDDLWWDVDSSARTAQDEPKQLSPVWQRLVGLDAQMQRTALASAVAGKQQLRMQQVADEQQVMTVLQAAKAIDPDICADEDCARFLHAGGTLPLHKFLAYITLKACSHPASLRILFDCYGLAADLHDAGSALEEYVRRQVSRDGTVPRLARKTSKTSAQGKASAGVQDTGSERSASGKASLARNGRAVAASRAGLGLRNWTALSDCVSAREQDAAALAARLATSGKLHASRPASASLALHDRSGPFLSSVRGGEVAVAVGAALSLPFARMLGLGAQFMPPDGAAHARGGGELYRELSLARAAMTLSHIAAAEKTANPAEPGAVLSSWAVPSRYHQQAVHNQLAKQADLE